MNTIHPMHPSNACMQRRHHIQMRSTMPVGRLGVQSPAPGFCRAIASSPLRNSLPSPGTPALFNLGILLESTSRTSRALNFVRVEPVSGPSIHPAGSVSDRLFRLRGAPPMATQCHRLAVHSSTARLSSPSACSSSSRCNSRVNQSSVFLRGQRLQLQRISQHSFSSRSRSPVQCLSSTFDSSSGEEFDKTGDGRVQNSVIANIMAKAPEPIRIFPWGKAWSLFVQRVVYNFWTVGKWLAIPVLAVSMLSELSYTLLQEKMLIIPAGMIGGIAFAGMMKETALELCSEFETGEVAWHLVALGLFFAALKFIGPYLPAWGRVSVPHFANGGLWQVIKLVNDWRKQHAEKPVKRS